MFLFAHDQDRAGRRAHDPFGGAADAEMFPAGITMRGNDDEIDVHFLRQPLTIS